MRFVELDQQIEEATGLALGDVFTLHGEAYYRRVERDVLGDLLAAALPCVIATGGSIVNDAATYDLLRARCRTIWLKARPEDHWNRVVAQGDRRPMAENPHAFAELRALLAARTGLYARADVTIDTTKLAVRDVVAQIAT
jgi:XRE family aerobic/anaerobic benzoate catabolism transcriptional regulator